MGFAVEVLNEVMGLSLQDRGYSREVDAAMSDVRNSVDRMAVIDSAVNKSRD